MTRKIKINDKERPVAFRMLALKTYTAITGSNLIEEGLYQVIKSMDPNKVCAVVYAAMVCGFYVENGFDDKKKPDFTLEQIEMWLGMDGEIFKEVINAYLDFVPKPKAGELVSEASQDKVESQEGNAPAPQAAG